ncbi:MAG: CBS domain-containing protein [Gammaproteobacteria bacterium]|nr:MAG: CBS domain-containing protein [Gammaproteobacteria bacterium]
MKNVRDILGSKLDPETYSVAPDAMVWDAIKLMSEKSVGALLVTDMHKLVGIVSERDYMRKVALLGRSSKSTEVKDIMTANPITVTPEETMDACMALMTEKRIRHLPVVSDEKLFGMLSIRDLLESTMEEQKHLIQQLEQYIRGESY